MIRVTSIPSRIPGWYDPQAPCFTPKKDWAGARVRITIPVGNNPNQDLEEARERLSKKYVGAELHLVPDFQTKSKPSQINPNVSQEQMLLDYFSHLNLPEDVSAEQLTEYLIRFLPPLNMFGIQRMEFQKVVADNVLSYDHAEWDLTQKGIVCITGINQDWNNRSNGAGKSNFTSLPFVAMFGRTFKEQVHDGWANQNNDRTAKCELTIQLADQRILRIFRQRRPSLFRVYLDDTEVTMGDQFATQKLIENITGLSWEILQNAVYIGQHEIGSAFGTEKERKELFSRLLGFDRFLDIQARLRKIANRIERDANDIATEIRVTESNLEQSKNHYKELQTALKNMPATNPNRIKQLEAYITKGNNDIGKIRTRIEDIKQKKLKAEQTRRELNSEMVAAETRINMFTEHIQATMQVKSVCSLCGSQVSKDRLQKHQDDLHQAISNEEASTSSLRTQIQTISNTIRSLAEKIHEHEDDQQAIRTGIREYGEELSTLREQSSSVSRINSLIQSNKHNITQYTRTLDILKRAYEFTLEEKRFVDICTEAVGRNGLPAYLCGIIEPQLNEAAKFYSEIFSDDEISVQFLISGGDIDIRVYNYHGGHSFKDQSAGETRIAALITAFAFREILVPINLLMLDEPSEGLDAVSSVTFAHALRRVADRFGQIVVISHNSNLLGTIEPDQRIEIVKSGRTSNVRQI